MARLDVPNGPGGEAAMIWTLRPELGGMVERMIRGAYQKASFRQKSVSWRECASHRSTTASRVRTSGHRRCSTRASHRSCTRTSPPTPPTPTTPRASALRSSTPSASPPSTHSIDDAFFGRLRALFSDEEILDLTLCVAVFLGLGRSLTVLGVDQSCAIDV